MADESKAGESNLTVVTATPDTFDATLEKHLGHPRLFTLFTGAVSETTGKSCVADPIIMKALESQPGTLLIECPVLRSEYKGNPKYFYRTHAKVKLQAVPTLMRWGERRATGSLVETKCANAALVAALVADDSDSDEE